MKLGPATKFDMRNATTSKRFADDAILTNCDTIVIFPILSYPEAGPRMHGLPNLHFQ